MLLRAARDGYDTLQVSSPELRLAPVGPAFAQAAVEWPGVYVAFCVHCHDRGWQARQAVPLNLAYAWPCRRWARFLVADFGSTDGTVEWLAENCWEVHVLDTISRIILSKLRPLALPLFSFCPQAIESRQLMLVVGPWEGVYHTAKAKNTAHRQAMSRFVLTDDDIVVNIDVDNIMNPGFAEHVAAAFRSPATCVQYFAGQRHDGTYGRIAASVGHFCRTRGYDENSEAAGSHDGDLIQRLQWEQNCKFRCFSTATVNGWPLTQAIKNTKGATIAPDAGPVAEMNRRNAILFKDRRLQNLRLSVCCDAPKPRQIL